MNQEKKTNKTAEDIEHLAGLPEKLERETNPEKKKLK